MRALSRLAVTAIVAFAALTSPAVAWENPGQTPVTDSILVEALEPSAAYWQRATGQTPCNPLLWMYDARVAHPELPPDSRGAEATFPEYGCEIWFDRVNFAALLSYLSSPETPDDDNRWAAKMVCQLMTHERGHNLGHQHSPSGIMDGLPTLYASFVPECEAWAATSPWLRNRTLTPPAPDVEGSNAPRPVMTVTDRVPSARVARLAPRVRRCQRARYRRAHRASCQRVSRQYRAAKGATR